MADAEGWEPRDGKPLDGAVLSADEFLQMDYGRREAVIPGVINAREMAFMYAQVGQAKTLVAMDMAIAVATGRCAFNSLPARQGRALIVGENMHPARYQAYLRMLLNAARINEVPDLFFWPRQFLRLDDIEIAAAFVQQVVDLAPSFVVLDAFMDLHSGDGFTGRELRPVLDMIVELPERVPCAVLVIDHPRKEGEGKHSDPIDALYGGRMKSAIADRMLTIKKVSDAPSRFVLTTVKTRTEPQAPITLTFTPENGFTVEDSVSCLTPSAQKVAVWLRAIPSPSRFTKANIVTGTGLSSRSVDAAVSELSSNRMLVAAGKDGRATTYAVPNDGHLLDQGGAAS